MVRICSTWLNGAAPASALERLRILLGGDLVYSQQFTVTYNEENDSYTFDGRGSGHAVGMSQWGAKGMADIGFGYKDILEFYFTGAEVY